MAFAKIAIRCNATGEVRFWTHERDAQFEDGDYQWMLGNYSCDCNRKTFFDKKHNENPCGAGAYTAMYGVREDRSKFSLEEEPPK